MNLARIALMRAEEQVAPRGAEILRNPEWRAPKKPRKVGKGRPITCLCGECTKCHKREWQRRDREKRAQSGVSPRICTVEGCRKHVHTRGRCWRHWKQFKAWGVTFPNRRRVASPEVIERLRAKLAERGIAA